MGLSLGLSDVRQGTPLASWFEASPSGTTVTVHGTLVEDASPSAAGASLLLDVSAIETASPGRPLKLSGGIRLSVAGTLLEDRLREWRPAAPCACPRSCASRRPISIPAHPDERPALARKGIVLVGSVKSAALVEVVARGSLLQAAAALWGAIRRRVNDRLGRSDPGRRRDDRGVGRGPQRSDPG